MIVRGSASVVRPHRKRRRGSGQTDEPPESPDMTRRKGRVTLLPQTTSHATHRPLVRSRTLDHPSTSILGTVSAYVNAQRNHRVPEGGTSVPVDGRGSSRSDQEATRLEGHLEKVHLLLTFASRSRERRASSGSSRCTGKDTRARPGDKRPATKRRRP